MKLAGLAVAAGLVVPLPAPAAPARDWREAATAALVETLVRPDEPGLAVLVRQDGRTVFARGYGVRDLRSRERIDPGTGFRLASVTKPFTAMAVMLLVRDGKLRYEAALTDVLPAFPAYGRAITIRHLLTHTSGLPDYEERMAAAEKGRAPLWTADRQIRDDEVLALLRSETKGRFAPGTSWAYSNSGYVVLGVIVARVSGEPFGAFLRGRIFAPLGMEHTLAYEKGRNEVRSRAYGHTRDGGGFREADQSPTSATLGDGGVYSTLEDLARWDEALRGNELLSPAWMKPALTRVTLADGSATRWPPGEKSGDNLDPGGPVAYGFGWFLDPWHGRPRAWHHGDTTGFRTVIQRFPDDALTVVVLANRDDLDATSLALEVAAPWLRIPRTGRADAPREGAPPGR
ncbi:MAG TPA: serine hydrolase domain-containing protein [Vicinamibacteria bacterium]|nr:serine hydrolase domain-containing protein [Vicinamibacteria bacterium]